MIKYKEHPSIFQIQHFWNIITKYKCKKILDAGCGIGWFGKFKPEGVEVRGIDLHKEQVKMANKYEIARVGNIEKLPYANDTFDAIFCYHVLEHVENPKKAVKEFSRVLSTNGIIIAEVPSKWDPNLLKDPTHKQSFTKETFSEIFKHNNFEILSEYYCALEIKKIKNKYIYMLLGWIGKIIAKLIKSRRRAIRIIAIKVKKKAMEVTKI